MTIIKNLSIRSEKIKNATTTLFAKMISLSIKFKIIKAFKRRQTNVYVEKIKIIETNHEQNVSIKHKSLMKNNYLFESVWQIDFEFESYLIAIHAVIFSI